VLITRTVFREGTYPANLLGGIREINYQGTYTPQGGTEKSTRQASIERNPANLLGGIREINYQGTYTPQGGTEKSIRQASIERNPANLLGGIGTDNSDSEIFHF